MSWKQPNKSTRVFLTGLFTDGSLSALLTEIINHGFDFARLYQRVVLINAEDNIISITLQHTTGVYESNFLAAPLAEGDAHYINNAAAIGAAILVTTS